MDIHGPCEFFQTGSNVNVQGKAEENGITFLAEIDKGKLSKNDPLEVSWPNGYVLTIKPE